jgi:YbbR domain-containing protein
VNTKAEYSQGSSELSKAVILLSRADMELSRAQMELSKTEISVGGSETKLAKLAKITIALFLVPIGYGVWIIILAEREERSHKNSLKR